MTTPTSSLPLVTQAEDLTWQSRDEYPQAAEGRVRWKTLLDSGISASQDLVMGLLEMSPGEALVRHGHAPAESYFIISGEGQVEIEGLTYPLKQGSAAFVPPGARHQLQNTGSVLMRVLYHFPVDAFRDVIYEYDERSG